MSAVDAGFLYLERPECPLHIAGVAILDGTLEAGDLMGHIESRLGRLRRYTQRPFPTPLSAGHPSWHDATDFDVRNHIQRWALPSPGGMQELLEVTAQLIARPLDRSRPLWEMHVLEGLDGDRTALVQKVHHCMVDGVSGAQLLEQILDPSPEFELSATELPSPEPPPTAGARLGRAVAAEILRPLGNAYAALGALRRPSRARESAQRLAAAARTAFDLAASSTPVLPWSGPLGPRRSLSLTRLPLDGVRRVCAAGGGTVNDVVLCVLAGGLHHYLCGMGVQTRGLPVTALVPVSLRRAHEAQALGNRISAMLVPLAVEASEEEERFAATCAITRELKQRAAWVGMDTLCGWLDRLPAPLVALAGRRLRPGRIASVVATNIRGPGTPRYLCGHRVDALYPIVPITDHAGLGLAVFSYDGWLHVGLNADAEQVADLDKLRQGIEQSFARLVSRA